MATYTWNGSTADWSNASDWGGTVPGSSDTAVLDAPLTLLEDYTVSIASGESYSASELQIAGVLTALGTVTVDISGSLTVGTLNYSATIAALSDDVINVEAGGTFDITSAISNSGVHLLTGDTINVAGTGTGGHLELGSTSVYDSNIAISFTNNATGENKGLVEYLTATSGATVAQEFENLAWGDRIIFDGLNLTGDTATYNNGQHTLTITSGSGRTTTTVLTLTDVRGTGTLHSSNFVLSGDGIDVVCFAAGTRILTEAGEKAVETLVPGDLVVTTAGDASSARPVKWLGRRRIDIANHPRPETVAPILIERGAFAQNVPHRDLLVSPDHAIFVDGKLIAARQLINGVTIRRDTTCRSVEYFHVELDAHAVLLAEGLAAESYLDTNNRGFFANSGQPYVLYPDMTDESDISTREAKSCHPFVSDQDSVLPVWQQLADRAAALGQAAAQLETTHDAAPCLRVAGRLIQPMRAMNGVFTFVLPLGTSEVALVSRAGSPSDVRPWLDDRRSLGVSVKRIIVHAAGSRIEVPVDHADFTKGWWDVERNGAHTQRWTNGEAVMPLPQMAGQIVLELRLDSAEYVLPRVAGFAQAA